MARSIAWQVWKRVTGRPWTLAFGSHHIRCYPDTGSAANVIYFTERFDPTEFDFLDRYLRPGDSVVDVGANVGLYALWMAQLVGSSGRVDAFEAAPRTVSRLRENIRFNGLEGLVVVHEAAAAAHDGHLDFYVDFDVSNGVVPQGGGSSRSRTTRVDAVMLDSALPALEYALAKVDVEGAEELAFNGWKANLERGNPPVILVEVLAGQLTKQGSSPAQLADLVSSLGYDCWLYEPATRSLVAAAIEEISGNAVLVRRDRMAMVSGRLGRSDQ